MSDNELKWETKDANWEIVIATAVGFFFIAWWVFDSLTMPMVIGLALGVVMIPLSAPRSVAIEADTVTYNNGDGEHSVPVSELAALYRKPGADVLVLEFTDGAKIAIDVGNDDEAAAEFVERVHATPELHHIG